MNLEISVSYTYIELFREQWIMVSVPASSRIGKMKFDEVALTSELSHTAPWMMILAMRFYCSIEALGPEHIRNIIAAGQKYAAFVCL